jgi:hypothetical protein
MKPFKLLFLFIASCITINAISAFSTTAVKSPVTQKKLMVLDKGDDYSELWKKVDSLDAKGLPQSALEEVKKIFERAQKENNGTQVIKATIYTMKYNSYLKEDDFVLGIHQLNGMAAEAKAPQKQMLHSIIGQVYWGYYQSNRYKFLGRTHTTNFKNEDVRTWDLQQFAKVITYHFLMSLSDAEVTKKTAIESFKEILERGDFTGRALRPSVYDFLAHHAISFFANHEFDVVRPAYTFKIDQGLYFGAANDFVREDISSRDSFSTKFYALRLYQDLTSFHIGDAKPDALIHIELERLAFVHSNSVLGNKDTLYYGALTRLSDKYAKDPAVAEVRYFMARALQEQGLKYQAMKNPIGKWELKRAEELCNATIEQFPDSYGAEMCKALLNEIQRKSLSLKVEDIIASEKSSHLIVESANVDKVWIRIVEVGWDFHGTKTFDDQAKYIKHLLGLNPVKSWEQNLQNDGDHQRHNLHVELPPLKKGYYVVLAGTDAQFNHEANAIAYARIGVSDLAYSTRRVRDESGFEITVFDRNSGHPKPQVKAQLYYREYNYRTSEYENKKGESYTTDANGQFRIPSSKKDYRYFYIDFSTANDRFNSDESFYQSRPYRYNQKTTTTYFFTDRSIYRPGQTIYFKGIRLFTDENGDNPKLATGQNVRVTLYDMNYQRVTELTLGTNEYGSFSGSFTAPQGVSLGQMHLTDGYGTKYFSVEEYKRPKFEVEFKPVTGNYKLEQLVKVTGFAKAYAGSNIDGAKVSYRVTRSVYYPYRWYYWDYWYSGNSVTTEIMNGETITKEDGTFDINFFALPDKSINLKDRPAFMYTVSADVTDINGETRSASTTVNVGVMSMVLNVGIPSDLLSDFKNKIAITASNLNYQPVNAKGSLSISKLRQPDTIYVERRLDRSDRNTLSPGEFSKKYPGELYADEKNMRLWKKEKEILKMDFNTANKDSLNLKDLSKWEAGHYILEAVALDSFGVEVKDLHYFTITHPRKNEMPFYEAFEVRDLANTYEPGQKAEILLATKYTDVRVLMEVEEKNQIVSRQWITLSNEQKIVTLPIEEKHRGGFGVHFTMVRNNRFYNRSFGISVPYTNKQLDIEFETFRNKILPGSKEEWKLKIRGKQGEKLAAEMLLTMYDASLDAFASNGFWMYPYRSYYADSYWTAGDGFASNSSTVYAPNWNTYVSYPQRQYDALNWFGYSYWYYGGYDYYRYPRRSKDGDYEDDSKVMLDAVSTGTVAFATEVAEEAAAPGVGGALKKAEAEKTVAANEQQKELRSGETANTRNDKDNREGKNLDDVKARSNMSETAFFYPHLETDAEGRIVVSFTAPEALTKWKVLGIAHTQDLKIGTVQNELVTQKELMVMPNAPRFFRENDRIVFTAKISNISEKDLNGTAQLQLFDALSNTPLNEKFDVKTKELEFSVKKGQSTAVAWELQIPEGIGAVTYRIVAKAGSFSDGEEMAIPVLTNSMLVTESLPLPVRKAGTKNFRFEKLSNSGKSNTLRHHKLTLEFTNNPAWYAIQAMPYMMEYPYECAEQTFTRFYANSIATHIMNSNPKIKTVFDAWKSSSPEAFMSNLQKNQELKALMLEETPWVLDAQDESERKKRVAVLFDLNRMSNELNAALRKLEKAQVYSGGWPWFPGMEESRYITTHIITGMGHLDKLGVKNVREDRSTWNMVSKGVYFLDRQIVKDYDYIIKYHKNYLNEQHIGYDHVQYLYARSYFKDLPMTKETQDAVMYFKKQAEKYWLNFNLYAQGMLGLAAHRFEMKALSGDIVKSVREKAIRNEELGMYWKDNVVGYYWYQSPIETHALMIELFDEAANDLETIEELKVWLLKNKQTTDWKTTKATAEACYALLLRGSDLLVTEMAEIKVGGTLIDPAARGANVEAGTGYFKTSWSANEIRPEMGNISITRKKDGVAWGAMYWQYFEQLDKITPHETPLKIKKQLFLVKHSDNGPVMTPVNEKSPLKPGDRVRVRIVIEVDRAMEFVHMKDMRASCFEPVNVFSQYKWQDGLGYYESTRDAATNFFFDRLPKGTHVFEYDMFCSHAGNFSNGITTIQCMYAPEFTSHSEGIRVSVTGK